MGKENISGTEGGAGTKFFGGSKEASTGTAAEKDVAGAGKDAAASGKDAVTGSSGYDQKAASAGKSVDTAGAAGAAGVAGVTGAAAGTAYEKGDASTKPFQVRNLLVFLLLALVLPSLVTIALLLVAPTFQALNPLAPLLLERVLLLPLLPQVLVPLVLLLPVLPLPLVLPLLETTVLLLVVQTSQVPSRLAPLLLERTLLVLPPARPQALVFWVASLLVTMPWTKKSLSWTPRARPRPRRLSREATKTPSRATRSRLEANQKKI